MESISFQQLKIVEDQLYQIREAIARRMGISQSLMAQYISGKKKVSEARKSLIIDTVRKIGQELVAV